MSERQSGEERRVAELIDPNVLLLLKNQAEYFEKLLLLHKEAYDRQLQQAVEGSRRERAAETARVDANRAGDIAAVGVANDRAIKQAELLNAQMMDTAETMRKSVETTATTIAVQFDKLTTQINERIAALERINAENLGKATVAPDWQQLVNDLRDASNVQKGASKRTVDLWGWGIAAVMIIITGIEFFTR